MTPLRFYFLLLSTFFISAIVRADERQIRIVTDEQNRTIAVETLGWSKDELATLTKSRNDEYLAQRVRVYVLNDKGQPQLPQLAGRFEIVDQAVRFIPQFPFRPATRYEVNYFPTPRSPLESPAVVKREITIPAQSAAEPTRVTAIYPSAATLPENQLRFYIHFSAPMAAGHAYEHVKLIKPDGTPDKRAFLEIGEEMWDRSGQRLTLLFDPGRVKKGLKPREEFGPVLEPGKTYRLLIGKDWLDANDQPLAAGIEKRFTAGPAIEAALDTKQWKITPPATGSRNSLIVQFPRPLDSALLMRMLTIADSAGKEIAGQIVLAAEERCWQFRPDQPWAAGNYFLVADTALEDTTGNNIARPFEVDVFERVDDKPGPEFVRIPFSIGAKK
jgi:hypothetical protein